jgi:hypothetical protein
MGLFSRRQDAGVSRTAEFTPVDGEQLFVGELSYQAALTILLAERGHAANSLMAIDRPVSEQFVARLTPEPDNQYDVNAVGVHVSGRLVAYLSRANAMRYRAAFGTAMAEVPVVLWVKPAGKGIVSVWPER